jgi:peptidoglycan/LPS O-acetylase OafA/YrhL
MFAFLGVFLFHFNLRLNAGSSGYPNTFNFLKNIFSYGDLGVNFFFVLSGFLITYLLMYEEALSEKYTIFNFWVRRILRIWPLYFGIVVYGFLIYAFLYSRKSVYTETAEIKYYLSFLPNFNIIHNGFPTNPALTVLWSVGVEEQFYFIWPLLLLSKKFRPYSFPLIILFSFWFRFVHHDSFFILKFHSFSVMNDIAIGAGLAWTCFRLKLKQDTIRLSKIWIAFFYILGMSYVFLSPSPITNPLLMALRPFLISLFFCFILFEQVFLSDRLCNFGQIKSFDKWGKYTYGLYCLHIIGILIAYNLSKLIHLEQNMLWVISGELLLSFGISMLFAFLSYTYLEKPFLRLKKRFSKIETG